jgi:hypothetical protein
MKLPWLLMGCAVDGCRTQQAHIAGPPRMDHQIGDNPFGGQKVMLDRDLAKLYGVETKQLKRAVRRNIARFPKDFMFELTKEELDDLRSQSGTSSWGGTRYLPMVFTEQGVAMLSSVLTSERAAQVNIEIMRAFVRLRQMLAAHTDLERRLDALEESRYDEQFKVVFDAIRALMKPPEKPRKKIGFEAKEGKAVYRQEKKRNTK